MSIPRSRLLYGKRLDAAQKEWAGVADAIGRFEPVTMVVPKASAHFRSLLGPHVDLLELPYDDGWMRDSGPIFLSDGASLDGLDWGFNGWGGAFDKFGQTWHLDDAFPGRLCADLGVGTTHIPMILEGGSVQCDGEGTIITTEECLLNPDRNPSMTKDEIERSLLSHFNAQKVVWLPYGLLHDLTSGHVDGVCIFIGPGRVLAQTDPENSAENTRLQANLDVLRSSADARGRTFDVVEFPILPRAHFAGGPLSSHCYINFAYANGGLVVPLAGLEAPDRAAIRRLQDLFPDREVMGVPTPTMTWAGGGAHCVTQQMPAVS